MGGQCALEYAHVRYIPRKGRWTAWVREPKLGGERIFLGMYSSVRLAVRSQDRALLKLEMDPTRIERIVLTFNREDYKEDEELRRSLSRDEFIGWLRHESKTVDSGNGLVGLNSACLRKFMDEDRDCSLKIPLRSRDEEAEVMPTLMIPRPLNILPPNVDLEKIRRILAGKKKVPEEFGSGDHEDGDKETEEPDRLPLMRAVLAADRMTLLMPTPAIDRATFLLTDFALAFATLGIVLLFVVILGRLCGWN